MGWVKESNETRFCFGPWYFRLPLAKMSLGPTYFSGLPPLLHLAPPLFWDMILWIKTFLSASGKIIQSGLNKRERGGGGARENVLGSTRNRSLRNRGQTCLMIPFPISQLHGPLCWLHYLAGSSDEVGKVTSSTSGVTDTHLATLQERGPSSSVAPTKWTWVMCPFLNQSPWWRWGV